MEQPQSNNIFFFQISDFPCISNFDWNAKQTNELKSLFLITSCAYLQKECNRVQEFYISCLVRGVNHWENETVGVRDIIGHYRLMGWNVESEEQLTRVFLITQFSHETCPVMSGGECDHIGLKTVTPQCFYYLVQQWKRMRKKWQVKVMWECKEHNTDVYTAIHSPTWP